MTEPTVPTRDEVTERRRREYVERARLWDRVHALEASLLTQLCPARRRPETLEGRLGRETGAEVLLSLIERLTARVVELERWRAVMAEEVVTSLVRAERVETMEMECWELLTVGPEHGSKVAIETTDEAAEVRLVSASGKEKVVVNAGAGEVSRVEVSTATTHPAGMDVSLFAMTQAAEDGNAGLSIGRQGNIVVALDVAGGDVDADQISSLEFDGPDGVTRTRLGPAGLYRHPPGT